MRSVPEWIGKTDDTKIPGRVQVRLFDKANGKCQGCGGHLLPGCFAFDHIIAIANGGENRESNLQVLCTAICHVNKSRKDRKIQAARTRKFKIYKGMKTPSRNPVPGSKNTKWAKRYNRETGRFETVER